MTISVSSRKAKGRNFQNWVAGMFSLISNIPVGKDKDIQGREMGQTGVDIKFYGHAAELFPYSIECKAQERLSIPEWVKQAKENQKENTDWLLFIKQNRKEPLVVMDVNTFFTLLSESIRKDT